jgi:NAD(P)H-dependent FMN reductase
MKIGIVLGSSRAERLGERVCRFVMARADQVPEAEFALFDLTAYKLPFFDEAIPPWNNPARQAEPNVQFVLRH